MTKKVQNHCPIPEGTLLVIGGHEDKGQGPENMPEENYIKDEVLKKFIELTHKKKPKIELITSASSVSSEQFRDYEKAFKKLGIEDLGHLHHNTREEVMADNMEERIRHADAFFFAGGDQLKLTSIYGGTPLLTHLKQRYISDKIVVAGTSAGAMSLSTPMIYAGTDEKEETTGAMKVTTGLEFLKDVLIDTHFVDRGRFVRMAQVIATNPTSVGIGVEENTALIVRYGGEGEVIGNGCIIVIEGFDMTRTNIIEFTEKKAVSMWNLKVHILARGDKYLVPQINPPHK
jgi:cyanophycinase